MSDHKLGKRCCGTLGRALLKVGNSMNSLYIYIFWGGGMPMMRNSLSILSPQMGVTPLAWLIFHEWESPANVGDHARYCYFVFGVAQWPLSNLRLVVCWRVGCVSTFPHLAAMTSGPFNFLWTHVPKMNATSKAEVWFCEVDNFKDRPWNG